MTVRILLFGLLLAGVAPGCRLANNRPFRKVGSAAPAALVVFTARSLRVDRLESPIALPVTVGSQPSPALILSSDPSLVSIGEDGTLLAHRAGSAQLTSRTGGGILAVIVSPGATAAAQPQAVVRNSP
jgi:hypothetical protein